MAERPAIFFQKKLGVSVFRATMTENRFQFLINCLRFDNKDSRKERAGENKLAPITYLWEKFIENCKKYYTPGEYVTIDEQLLSIRGRCSFKVYIPNKPDKYGLKIVMMCDSKTFYVVSGIPYIGKEKRERSTEALPTQYVLKLCETIYGTNRNVTMDRFSSSDLAKKKLLEKKN